MAARSRRATCSASDSPKTLGRARKNAAASTTETRMYFQRAYSSMQKTSGSLQRALRHQSGDLKALHLDTYVVSDFKRDEVVTHFDDAAENATGGDDFVARGELA